MISLIEALNFRCLKYVRQPLGPFHVLVGPNASGKTTFLDVAAFLGRLVSDGPDAAVAERTNNFEDLLWKRSGSFLELAIEADLPSHLSTRCGADTIRYEVRLGYTEDNGEVGILAEKVLLKSAKDRRGNNTSLFPSAPAGIISEKRVRGRHAVVSKVFGETTTSVLKPLIPEDGCRRFTSDLRNPLWQIFPQMKRSSLPHYG